MHTYKFVQMYIFCLFFFTLTYFGNSCDHLLGVSQYKHQEYKRNHIKYITKLSQTPRQNLGLSRTYFLNKLLPIEWVPGSFPWYKAAEA